MAPVTARHLGWTTWRWTAPRGILLYGVAAMAVAEIVVAQGGVVAAVVEVVLLVHLLRDRAAAFVTWRGCHWRPLRQRCRREGESALDLWLWACLAATAGAQVVRLVCQGGFQLPGQGFSRYLVYYRCFPLALRSTRRRAVIFK